MEMYKKAQFSYLGKIIMFLVASLVLLAYSTNLFGIIGSVSKTSSCHASAVANSLGNSATLGSDAIKLNCPVHYVKIFETSKEGKSYSKLNSDVEVFSVDKPFTSAERKFLDKINYYLDKKAKEIMLKEKSRMYLYRINEIVAKQMKNCWTDLGEGKLNLFSSWFSTFGTEVPKNDESSLKSWLSENIPHTLEAPTVCVICSRIEIDPELYSVVKEYISESEKDPITNPDSLVYWLTHHPIPRSQLSYYEFLLDDINRDVFGPDKRNYKYTEEPFAVIFARTNVAAYKNFVDDAKGSLLTTALGGIFGGKYGAILGFFVGGGLDQLPDAIKSMSDGDGAVSSLYVIPYNKESLSEYCSVLAN